MEETFTYDNYVQDPTCQQGFNRYAYCFYNPLKYIDPSGERCFGPSEAEKAQMSWNAARQQRQSEIYGDVCQQLQSGMRPNGILDVCGGIAKYFNTVCSEGNSTQENISGDEPECDNYAVDEYGRMVYEKTDDSYDVLYNGDKSESIRIDKGKILCMYYDRVKNPNDGKWYSYLVIKVRDDDCAKTIFEFFAKYSSVEWSRSMVGASGDMGLNYITTTHLEGTEYGGFHLYHNQLKSYTFRGNDHSHDNCTVLVSPGDVDFANMIQNQHPNAQFNIFNPCEGIYVPFDRNSTPGLFPEIIITP